MAAPIIRVATDGSGVLPPSPTIDFMQRFAPGLALLLLAACSTEPDTTFAWAEQPITPGRSEPTLESASPGTIRARGSLPTPCLHYRLRRAVDQQGATVTLRLLAEPSSDGCLTAIGTLYYDLTIEDLRAGTYRVHLVHEYPGPTPGWGVDTAVATTLAVE